MGKIGGIENLNGEGDMERVMHMDGGRDIAQFLKQVRRYKRKGQV